MKIFNIIELIICLIALLSILSIILYKYYSEKLNNVKFKLDNSHEEYESKLLEKYDTLTKLIDLVETKYKLDIKLFNDIKSINTTDIINIDDNMMMKCYKEIIQIKEDNQKTRELKAFRELINLYEEIETYTLSLRTYYNKYVLEYNNMIKKFPYNIISKIQRLNIENLLEGNELNFVNDLEV